MHAMDQFSTGIEALIAGSLGDNETLAPTKPGTDKRSKTAVKRKAKRKAAKKARKKSRR